MLNRFNRLMRCRIVCSYWNQDEFTKVGEKREPQVSKLDKLKLKVVVLHDGIGKEVHMTQPVRFAAKDLVTVT